MTRKYHEMTLDEIKAKYYIYVTGNENTADLRTINAKLSRLWQDASYYFNDSETQYKDAKRRLERIEDQLEHAEKKSDWRLISENKLMEKSDRMSDKARETAKYIETRTDELIAQLITVKDLLCELEDEVSVWHSIKKNLMFIADRVGNSGMNMGTEAKMMQRDLLFKSERGDKD